ncbi:MAG TPA: C10 family peptidase [Bacteroidales bacterium]|nr:C10 family peptidase [Bacteroidales bacterium]
MRKVLFLFLILLLGPNIHPALSQSVQMDRARLVAKNFFYQRINQHSLVPFHSIAIEDEFRKAVNDTVLYYVFNLKPDGYVIVPARESVPPVIGYSLSGTFGEQDQPCNFRSWMAHYEEELLWVVRNGAAPDENILKRWEAFSVEDASGLTIFNGREVEPLLASTWNQDYPYNIRCPEDPDGPHGHCLAGCVATAMGQLMYYYRWPVTGTGSYTYSHPDYGEISADFANTTYDWNNMTNNAQSSNEAIAELLFHIGVSVDMDYGPSSSGMWNHKAAYSYRTYFKYAPETQYVYRDSTSMDWDSLVVAHLDRAMPCYYAGWADYTYTSGHGFVVDGYQGEYFHMNWGWSGYLDGFFLLDELAPGGSDFNYAQELIINCFPDTLNYNYPPFCSGPDTLRALAGSFGDGSGPVADYEPNTFCSWLIDPQTAQDSVAGIALTFHQFQTAPGDTLRVYDGSTTSHPLLGNFSGSSLPSAISSESNQMLVTFTTDNLSEESGWACTYLSYSPVWCSGITTVTESEGQISDGSGTFHYGNNSVCQWRILPESAESLHLTFTSFDTEESGDIVKVYDLQSMTMLGSFSGSDLPGPVSCPSGKMLIMFVTNSDLTAGGWEAYYETYINGISPASGENQMEVYPVPVKERLFIRMRSGKPTSVIMTMLTLTGQVACQSAWTVTENECTTSIDISALQSGTYILHVRSNDAVQCKKVLIY